MDQPPLKNIFWDHAFPSSYRLIRKKYNTFLFILLDDVVYIQLEKHMQSFKIDEKILFSFKSCYSSKIALFMVCNYYFIRGFCQLRFIRFNSYSSEVSLSDWDSFPPSLLIFNMMYLKALHDFTIVLSWSLQGPSPEIPFHFIQFLREWLLGLSSI